MTSTGRRLTRNSRSRLFLEYFKILQRRQGAVHPWGVLAPKACRKSIMDSANQSWIVNREPWQPCRPKQCCTPAVCTPPASSTRVARSSRNRTTISNAASTTSGSSTGLSRTQWKQVRSLLRSNTNPHYHQIQQLQVLPRMRLQQAQREATQHEQQRLRSGASDVLQEAGRAASAAAAGIQLQHLHHHHHHSSSEHRHRERLLVQQVSAAAGLGSRFGSSSNSTSNERQLSSAGSTSATFGPAAPCILQPSNSSISSHSSRNGLGSETAAVALSAGEVLALSGAVVEEEPGLAAAGVSPLLLASLCLIESGGCPHAKQYRDHVGDVALGLCQMLLSTAQWLAGSKGFDRYGTCPSAADLEQPKACLYYAAAYLSILAQHNGCQRGEAFIVKAYHAGPKGVNSAAAALYWQKYAKARYCMRQVARCMAETVAAAAIGAGLPLVLPAGAAATSSGREHSPMERGRRRQQQQQQLEVSSSSSSSSSSPQQQQELQVWVLAAKLIAALSSRWELGAASAGVPGRAAAAAAEAAAASTPGSLMGHIFPHLSANSKAQQQQQQQQLAAQWSLPPQVPQQQQVAGSSGGGTGVSLLRRWRSGSAAAAAGSGSADGRAAAGNSSSRAVASSACAGSAVAASTCGALALVCVSRADLVAALQRLSCIDLQRQRQRSAMQQPARLQRLQLQPRRRGGMPGWAAHQQRCRRRRHRQLHLAAAGAALRHARGGARGVAGVHRRRLWRGRPRHPGLQPGPRCCRRHARAASQRLHRAASAGHPSPAACRASR
ncbi:hypothetical protein COO60DRAFT_641663 [Scenedesmus sp. NREL 46B-D3]|nr:hypothetical protein COO60DRAFT_641663 [Scenedesmus sp. NREL 46B-D3]